MPSTRNLETRKARGSFDPPGLWELVLSALQGPGGALQSWFWGSAAKDTRPSTYDVRISAMAPRRFSEVPLHVVDLMVMI